MASTEEMQVAMVNRSIRAIKAELEFLTDASVISPQTLSQILSSIPPQTALHAPISVGAVPTATPVPGAPQPPPTAAGNTSLPIHENPQKRQQEHGQGAHQQQQQQQPNPYHDQPPAYHGAASAPPPPPPPASTLPPPPLCVATALYVYAGEDAGDLSLQPQDTIDVTEYMNAEWWKGRSRRTGQEGIFPRSYVRVEEKGLPSQGPPPPQQQQQQLGNNYGNAPLETSGMGNGTGHVPGKGEEMGKKFGKKLGNAAIFGAGASIGANIVNGIF